MPETIVEIQENNFIIEIGNPVAPVTVTDGSSEVVEVVSPGPQGPKGDNGNDGADGVDGVGWLTGAANPTSGLGSDGDHYRNLTDNTVWYKESGAWTCIADLDTIDAGYF